MDLGGGFGIVVTTVDKGLKGGGNEVCSEGKNPGA